MTQPTDGHPSDNDSLGTGPQPVEFTDVVTSPAQPGSEAAPAPRTRGRALLFGGLAAVLLAGVGGAVAVQQLNGSGARPADVLPGDTFGYVQVDIDPSAGQKLAAVRFLAEVPEIKALESGDAREKLWDLAVARSGDDCLESFDFARDIAPWLGERIGFGVRPGGTPEEPNVVVALQASDEEAATSTLDRLGDCREGGDDVDLRTRDGYVIVTKGGQGDATLAAIQQGSLSEQNEFSGDMAALGEQGLASAWWDLGKTVKELAGKLPQTLVPGISPEAQGRVAAALRFDPGHAEIAGIARGLAGSQTLQPAAGDEAGLGSLPDDTIAAVHVSGGGAALKQAWPELEKRINAAASASGMDDVAGAIEDDLGLVLPDDLEALLGRSLTLSLPEQVLGFGTPTLGAQITTDQAERAAEVVTTIEEASGAAGILTKQVEGDRLYLSTTPDYVARLKAAGSLGDTESFKAALGDADDADFALYVKLDPIEKLYLGEVDAKMRPALESMRAVGLAITATGSGEAEFSFRVVAN